MLGPIKGEVAVNRLIDEIKGGGGVRESRSQSKRYTSYP